MYRLQAIQFYATLVDSVEKTVYVQREETLAEAIRELHREFGTDIRIEVCESFLWFFWRKKYRY